MSIHRLDYEIPSNLSLSLTSNPFWGLNFEQECSIPLFKIVILDVYFVINAKY